MGYSRMGDVDIAGIVSQNSYTPSPIAWEDQVFYFLMLDRFSDGQETGYYDNQGQLVTTGATPPFKPENARSIPTADWVTNGRTWRGGTLGGLIGKLGYLQRLGITALWVSPVFKQVPGDPYSYHGYGIQDFLSIDPHFGAEDDLVELVRAAHAMGIYVVLDIILNHTGNVFQYDADRYPVPGPDGTTVMDPRWDGQPYAVKGFYDAPNDPAHPDRREPTIPFIGEATHDPDAAVFPLELQDPATFNRKGHISNWDYDPEFREGDFFDLKDVHQGYGPADDYKPSAAMQVLANAYKYWIARADLDGFRIDTVKHMDVGAMRYFAWTVHEFAQTIGKEKFFLIGEITGGRTRACETLETTGLDAALGVDDIPDKLERLVKGRENPADYFDLFRNSLLVGKDTHTWFRDKVVTVIDDHDQVHKGLNKSRFCAEDNGSAFILNALALNALTLGIPCVYYGSEQSFAGMAPQGYDRGMDIFLRETMFGGGFGAFQSDGCHFFDEGSWVYVEFAKILEVRRQEMALRRGRQYLREISGDGRNFGLPALMGSGPLRSVVPWSRILDRQELVVAINTDPQSALTAWVTVDGSLHGAGSAFRCDYSRDAGQVGSQVAAEARNGLSIRITVPAAGCVIYKAV